MDEFVEMYLWAAIVSGTLFVLFWGVVIYLIIKFISGGSRGGPSTLQRMNIVAKVLTLLGGRSSGTGSPGPIESDVRNMAAKEGIDLDR